MVVNRLSDSYTPFHVPIIPENSAQSSEDGSGMRSPVFASGNYPSHNDNFRYSQDHLDVQHSTGMITPYDYGHTLSAQHPPMLDTSLQLPNSSARIPFSSHYSIQSRSNINFHATHSVGSRGVPSMDFRYSTTSERRLPNTSPDQSYTHPAEHTSTISTDDHVSSTHIESTNNSSTTPASSKPVQKEISNVVIACRQCRARKIRCDSTRPLCNNCVRRSNDCEYDEKPRRRGPDKRPGTRQRSCKKRPTDGSAPPPKQKRAATEQVSEKDIEPHAQREDSLESTPDSLTLDCDSPEFYHANLQPATSQLHAHPKHDLPSTYRRPSAYVSSVKCGYCDNIL